MILLHLLLLFVTPLLCGYMVLKRINEISLAEKIGLSMILGSGYLTIVLFFLHRFFDIQLSPLNLQVFLAVHLVTCTGFFLKGTNIKQLWTKQRRQLTAFLNKLTLIDKALLLTIAILVLHSLIQNVVWPVTDWDALALYDFRALVVADTYQLVQPPGVDYFYHYPPYTSLLHAFNYLLSIEQAKIWYSFLYLAFGLVTYGWVSRYRSRTFALATTTVVLSLPMVFEHSTIAYTNLPYTIFIVVGFMYLWDWFNHNTNWFPVIAFFSLGLSTWTRSSEPFWLIGLLFLFWGVFTKKISVLLSVVLVGVLWGIRTLWTDYARIMQPSSDLVGTTLYTNTQPTNPIITSKLILYLSVFQKPIPEVIDHLVQVSSYMLSYILPIFILFCVPAGIILALEMKRFTIKRASIWLTIFLILAIIFGGTYIFSFTYDTWDEIGGSAQRMSMCLPVLFVLAIASSPAFKRLKL